MKKKSNSQYILELTDKIERSITSLNDRMKLDIYNVDDLLELSRKHKQMIYKIYEGRRDNGL